MQDFEPGRTAQSAAAAIGSLWWMPLLRGIALIILGLYALARPALTLVVLAQIIGIFLVVDGLLAILAGIVGAVPSRGWIILRGILAVLVGLFVFTNPLLVASVAGTVLMYLVAFSTIMLGLLEIAATIRDRKQIEGEGWLVIGGVMVVLFGLVLAMAPLAFGLMMVRILGVFSIIVGTAMIVFAYRARKLGKTLESLAGGA